ncbi:dodecin domain-containing protein [Streptomyces syringium]
MGPSSAAAARLDEGKVGHYQVGLKVGFRLEDSA